MIFAAVVGLIIAIVLSAILYLKVLPARFDGTFKKRGLQFLHDYFTFKELYLETVLKVVFTIASIAFITVGLLGATLGNIIDLFGNIGEAFEFGYFGGWIWDAFVSNFFGGIIFAVAGPLALRLAYEIILMFVLLVKNVIEINNKLKAPEAPAEEPAPIIEVEPEEEPVEVEAEEVVEETVSEAPEAPAEEDEEETIVKIETSFEIGEPEEEETTEE